jgi:hypothetical protein
MTFDAGAGPNTIVRDAGAQPDGKIVDRRRLYICRGIATGPLSRD